MYSDTAFADPIFATEPQLAKVYQRSSRSKGNAVTETAQNTSASYWADCIVAIANSQDRVAFEHLFAHFAPRIKSFLMKRGANDHEAEECAQDVMVTVWQKAHLFDASRAAASTWVFTIARNRRIDALRKNSRPEPEELPWGATEEPDAAEVIAMQQETDLLAKAVAELPDPQRELVQQAFYGELTHHEIAEKTGLPLGTIKSRIRLGLERLRHKMK